MTEHSNEYTRRRKSRKKGISKVGWAYVVMGIAAIALYILGFNACELKGETRARHAIIPVSELLRVEIPEGTAEVFKDYMGFSVSFNPRHRVPNYVVWELTREEAQGQVRRSNDFHPDPDVEGCPDLSDYRGSGFDRGHMAPAGEMKWDARAMYDSHSLTNMCPQDRVINGGRWRSIENLEQSWVMRDSSLVIITGPILTDSITRTIGNGVSVPERFFRIIFAPYAEPPRAIGFIVPNSETPRGVFDMAMSVDEVESATGFDFFSALPDDIEDEMESDSKINIWRYLR